MRRLTALIATLAVLFALTSAPLFHLHTQDDHGNATAFVHAHFWHPEKLGHSAVESEEQDSHEQVRSIDLLAVDSPAAFVATAELSDRIPEPLLEVRENLVF